MTNIELTGNLTFQSIVDANPAFTTSLNPNGFTDVNQLYAELQNRGSLTLKNAILTLTPDEKKFFAFHKLTLINSKIVLNSTDTVFVCNEFEHEKSQIISFVGNDQTATSGNDGLSYGLNGQTGSHGMDAASCTMFITDKVKTIGGPIFIDLTGQNGGNGGDGKVGGKGTQGARGRDYSDGPIEFSTECTHGHRGERGDKGGDGGNGGNGGAGGKFEFRFYGVNTPGDYFFTFISDGGKGGYKGFGASGGEGGEGGKPGNIVSTWPDRRYYSGPRGEYGIPGGDGVDGLTGTRNHIVNSTFDVSFIKSYLTIWNGTKLTTELVFEFETGVTKTVQSTPTKVLQNEN